MMDTTIDGDTDPRGNKMPNNAYRKAMEAIAAARSAINVARHSRKIPTLGEVAGLSEKIHTSVELNSKAIMTNMNVRFDKVDETLQEILRRLPPAA